MSFAQINQMGGLMAAPQRPANPFADNADYMALQEYQRSLGPTEDELARLNELQTAFTSSDAYQSHQQEQQQRQQMMQMQRQIQQRGIVGQAPMQMQRQVPMMRHPMQQGGYGGGFGHQQMGNNTMQMLVALLSQAFAGGGGGMQQMGGGYGSQQAYGQMPQRQLGVMPSVGQATFEGPTANRGGYINQLTAAQPQNMQQQAYAQPQQASPFGGAARGYYA